MEVKTERIYYCARCNEEKVCPRGGCESTLRGIRKITTEMFLFHKDNLQEIEDYRRANTPFKNNIFATKVEVEKYEEQIKEFVDDKILTLIEQNIKDD